MSQLKKKVLFLLVIVIVLLGVFSVLSSFVSSRAITTQQPSFLNKEQPANTKAEVVVGGKRLIADVADTPATRTLGLSYRKSLAEDEGMLFVFEYSDTYGFWMKDMNFPIDIMWIDEVGKIIHIEKNCSPDTYPKTFAPTQPARYVLEVVSGFSDSHHVKVGDKIEFRAQI